MDKHVCASFRPELYAVSESQLAGCALMRTELQGPGRARHQRLRALSFARLRRDLTAPGRRLRALGWRTLASSITTLFVDAQTVLALGPGTPAGARILAAVRSPESAWLSVALWREWRSGGKFSPIVPASLVRLAQASPGASNPVSRMDIRLSNRLFDARHAHGRARRSAVDVFMPQSDVMISLFAAFGVELPQLAWHI